ncbi:phytanoyl-CoA dioxygenase family protein [Marinimicrobium agarilyticum]|uniref:phytanoyl-CoA dioxygenase family protein n=1 Tax=Marinimicrobium agarilyticum TaxID=306546 RepID=UPI00041A9CB5|nr:phytanoyl-CoA dioxygenase family protein [Marinimicrobium agarilyticum]
MNPRDHFEALGYTILRGLFNRTEISFIDKHVDPVYRKWAHGNNTEIYRNRLVNMHSLTLPEHFQDNPDQRVEFFEAIAPAKLTEAIEDIFGPGIHFHNTQLFFNPTNAERLPYWHRDMQYSPIEDDVQRDELRRMLSLHIRIPLVEERGVELVPGTHRRWDTELERNVRFELNDSKNSDPLPNSELIDLAPGDVLIFHAQMIHKGNYEMNSTRKALDLCVGKYHPLTSSFLDEHVLPTKAELAAIENSQWYDLAIDIASRNRRGSP